MKTADYNDKLEVVADPDNLEADVDLDILDIVADQYKQIWSWGIDFVADQDKLSWYWTIIAVTAPYIDATTEF